MLCNFPGGSAGTALPITKDPALPKELTSKFGPLKCELCKVSVRNELLYIIFKNCIGVEYHLNLWIMYILYVIGKFYSTS